MKWEGQYKRANICHKPLMVILTLTFVRLYIICRSSRQSAWDAELWAQVYYVCRWQQFCCKTLKTSGSGLFGLSCWNVWWVVRRMAPRWCSLSKGCSRLQWSSFKDAMGERQWWSIKRNWPAREILCRQSPSSWRHGMLLVQAAFGICCHSWTVNSYFPVIFDYVKWPVHWQRCFKALVAEFWILKTHSRNISGKVLSLIPCHGRLLPCSFLSSFFFQRCIPWLSARLMSILTVALKGKVRPTRRLWILSTGWL